MNRRTLEDVFKLMGERIQIITEVEIPPSFPVNMDDVVSTTVSGMTCMSCVGRVEEALNSLNGAYNIDIKLESGNVSFQGVSLEKAEQAIVSLGYRIGDPGESIDIKDDFNWRDRGMWKQSANNTKWCLVGCSIGEFGTLAAYQYYGIHHHLSWDLITPGSSSFDLYIIFLFLLPLINGLATSVMLETAILVRGQMDFKNALSTAFGMSFISMLMMEIAMEATDLIYTGGQLGLDPMAVIPMLVVGFLTPWPYNYWRLKKYGVSCH
tara:strand:+ start:80 stop:877 length:798 start_codon:yes stop_codon:yes gene_type:complete